MLTPSTRAVWFVAADMPTANRLTIHVMAAFTEYEREMISLRTKAALAVAKSRGVKLGGRNLEKARRFARWSVRTVRFDANVLLIIRQVQREGATTYEAIAIALTARGMERAFRRGRPQ
jgi:DNA invertase Pin-like site-specific DNA recombinase